MTMKRYFLALGLMMLTFSLAAQDDDSGSGGFQKNRLFTGGGLTLSFGNQSTVLGLHPVFGYSVTNWLDAGVAFNFVYQGVRHVTYYNPNTGAYFGSDDKLRQFTYGPGVFVKVYPVQFLFLQAQAEYNFISEKLIFDNGAPTQKDRTEALSFLVGAGYSGGRIAATNIFYYVSILLDVQKDRRSPYVEITRNGNVNMLPIIRAGLQIPLFQKQKN